MSKLTDLATPTSRARLPVLAYNNPHFRFLSPGRALGYRPHEGRSGSGSWIARYTIPGEKRYVRHAIGTADDERRQPDGETVLSFEQAVRKVQEWCDDQERKAKGLDPKDRKPYTVGRAMADYLDWMRANAKAPQQAEQVSRTHVLPKLADVEVADLSAARLRAWHKGIADSPPMRRSAEGEEPNMGSLDTPEDRRKRRNTANRALSVLKAALNFAFREGKVASDAEWRRVKPYKGVDVPRLRYLDTDAAVRLLNACEPDFRRLVRGALLTGCRYGELIRLRVSDFTAAPSPSLRLEDTKSGKGRHVFLGDEGAAFFADVTAGRPAGERLFLRADGEPWGRSNQTRRMREACTVARVEPVSFHALRHSYASLYLMNGGDLADLAEQLGHADTRMTSRVYGHLASRYRAERARQHEPKLGGDARPAVARLHPAAS